MTETNLVKEKLDDAIAAAKREGFQSTADALIALSKCVQNDVPLAVIPESSGLHDATQPPFSLR